METDVNKLLEEEGFPMLIIEKPCRVRVIGRGNWRKSWLCSCKFIVIARDKSDDWDGYPCPNCGKELKEEVQALVQRIEKCEEIEQPVPAWKFWHPETVEKVKKTTIMNMLKVKGKEIYRETRKPVTPEMGFVECYRSNESF
jgi:hypothetical protein